MMACIDEDVEKSSQTHQDDVGSGASSGGQNKTESTVIQVEAKFKPLKTTEERSARYVSTSLSERDTPSSGSSRSGDHECSRRDSPEYDRRNATGIYLKHNPKPEQMGDKGDKNEKENPISLHYPMLTRSNYAAWAIKMRVFMQAQGVWEAIEPRTRNTAIDVKKDKLALATIYQGIPEDLLLSLP
ncbi:ribonuclease H-like domain, reverse transcriptase, RNA-dependent DNA polymerase [Tanacetum coccineum]